MFRFLRYTFALCTLALAIASSVSCNKDKFEGPILVSDTINDDRSFLIKPDSTVKFYTHFKDPELLEFTWYLDGEKTDIIEPTYTFTAKEPGYYIITEEVKNEYATVMIDYYVLVRGEFDSGSFIFTNSSTNGELTFVNSKVDEIIEGVYTDINPDKTLGSKVTYATMMYGKMYIISKTEGLIVANAVTLKEITRIKDLPANPNCLIALNRRQALLSTDDGIYTINLNPLSIGNKVPGISERVGNLLYGKNYIFAFTLDRGLIALDQTTLQVKRILNVGRSGLTQDLSGNVWTSYMDTLYKVNPSLSVKKYLLPKGFRVYSSWNPWNEGSLCFAPTENSIFYVSSNNDGSPSGNIVKINVNTIDSYVNSVYKPITLNVFKTLDNNRLFSNIGLRISLKNNITAVTVNRDGSSPNIHVMHATDGSLVEIFDINSANPTAMLFCNVE